MVRDRPVLSSYLVDVMVVDSDRVEKRIRIRGATKSHEGLYQCIASNNVASVMKSSHVNVIKRTKVSIISETGPQELSIQAGERFKLNCNVDHDERNKITNIEWTKDGKSIQGLDNIDFGYDGGLTIFNVQTRHQGIYKCKVKTLRDSASAEVPLNVIVNGPVITRYSGHQVMFSGTSLMLECVATGIPAPEIRYRRV